MRTMCASVGRRAPFSAYGLLRDDFLADCPIPAGGDLAMEKGQLLDCADSVASQLDDAFGVSETDPRTALLCLCAPTPILPWPPKGDPYAPLRSAPLRQVVRPELGRREVWFNDEGERPVLESSNALACCVAQGERCIAINHSPFLNESDRAEPIVLVALLSDGLAGLKVT